MSIDIKRLKYLRSLKKLNQAEMANFLGVALGTYRNWEQGIRHPDTDTLIKLADFFEVSTDYLLGRNVIGIADEPRPTYTEAAYGGKLSELPQEDRQEIEDYIEFRHQKWLKEHGEN